MTRAVFLDRDGVLNRAIVRDGKPYPPKTLTEFELTPEAAPACQLLHEAGFLLIAVTNQPDIARGAETPATVEMFHQVLRELLPLDEIRVCPHDDADGCACRKPKPGMLLDAAAHWDIDLPASFMIGDRWRDIGAGRAAGCETVFLDFGYRETAPETSDFRTVSLLEAARWIVSR